MAPPRSINFTVVRLAVAGIVIVVGIFTSFYTVSADSQAVVLRFGKPIGKQSTLILSTDSDSCKFLKSSDAAKAGKDKLRGKKSYQCEAG